MPAYTEKSREYLRYAVEHEERAGKTTEPKLKAALLRLAREYRKLAGQLDAPWEPYRSGEESAAC